jgi:hypothetical protein
MIDIDDMRKLKYDDSFYYTIIFNIQSNIIDAALDGKFSCSISLPERMTKDLDYMLKIEVEFKVLGYIVSFISKSGNPILVSMDTLDNIDSIFISWEEILNNKKGESI